MKMSRVQEVAATTGYSVASVWRLAKTDADFPKPVKLSEKVTVWVEEEVQAYLQRRVAEARQGSA